MAQLQQGGPDEKEKTTALKGMSIFHLFVTYIDNISDIIVKERKIIWYSYELELGNYNTRRDL